MRLLQKPMRELVLFYAVLNQKTIVSCAFTIFSRPLLEYSSLIWSPRDTLVYLKDKLESVQRRCSKRLKGFGRISYAARLDRLKAETLELRRFKSDLTMMFSFIRSFVDIDCNSLLHIIDCESIHTRGHNLRFYKEHGNVNCRLNAFVCRNIEVWNRSPAHVVYSDSVAVFKHRLPCVNLVNFCSSGTY